MPGIPQPLLNRLRQVLLQCEQFESDRDLRAIFAYESLAPWRSSLLEADSLTGRVNNLIYFLHEKHHSDTKENALVLFVQRLSEQIDEGDERHQQLVDLAAELERSNNALPEPDAGLNQPFSLSAKPAFFLNQNQAIYQWLPVDIVTKYGLERGNYIGIILGLENDYIYENLISVERLLFNANHNQSSLKLPIRWWIRIAPRFNYRIPQNLSQVWDEALLLEPNNQLVKYLKYLQDQGIPDAITLGIILEINAQDLNQTLVDILQIWCSALVNKIFDSSRVAIIIHIQNNFADIQQPILVNLANQIAQDCSDIPIQTLILKEVYIQKCQEQKLDENVRNGAISNNHQERIAALILARNQTDIISDILMDSWVEASELQDERIPTGQDLNACPKTTINDLTWAILRQFSHHRHKVKSLVEQKLKPSLLKKYFDICSFCLGKRTAETAEDFLENATDEQIVLAVRAGCDIELLTLLEYFHNNGLDRPVFAWILAAQPPSLKSISELLTFDKEQRAVFGLCTQEEWQEINSLSEIKEQILTCKRYII
ncbi:MAG: hypothetical protein QNJ63_26065 [Calothrix sp. MO_192.B10]|nr:hypothetical protein [Calothrix sp. MO_192.B10]